MKKKTEKEKKPCLLKPWDAHQVKPLYLLLCLWILEKNQFNNFSLKFGHWKANVQIQFHYENGSIKLQYVSIEGFTVVLSSSYKRLAYYDKIYYHLI